MFLKKLIAVSFPLAIGGAVLAAPPPSGSTDTTDKMTDKSADKMTDKAAKLSESLSVLQAVSQWATTLSDMAEKNAKSDLVKDYAKQMAATSKDADAKLQAIAEKNKLDLKPLDGATEEQKSLMDRMKAEATMLGSLQGDAFDKEYMTLVTNTQQSVIHVLEANKAAAKDPEVKAFLAQMTTTVQGRLKKAQEIMAKVYGNTI